MAGLVERYGEAVVTRARVAVDIDAPVERVWEVVSDPRNLPRWDRHIVDVRGVPEGGLVRGSRYETQTRFMGIQAGVDAHVEEIDPPRYARIYLSGLLDAVVTTRVSPIDDHRSRLEQEVEFRFHGGTLGRLAARALQMTGGPYLALRRGVLAQKRQVEEAP